MVSQESVVPQSARPQASAPPLIVDAMLGSLVRWLRLAGYDTEFWREGSDDELIAAAQQQGRLIVTKDHGLAGRRGVAALRIDAETLDEQIDEARRSLSERGPAPQPFTRCAKCNGPIVDLPHPDADGLVPPYVWHTQREFRRCERCGRVYWKGTHYPAVQHRLSAAEDERPGLKQEGTDAA